MKNSNELFLQYRALVLMVKVDHDSRRAVGTAHDFYHAWRVASCIPKIAPDERTGELAWIAAMIHNTDHLLGHVEVDAKLLEYLDLANLNDQEKSIVLDAVQKHSHRNDPSDSQVLICLKDADRVVNMEIDVIMRAARHFPDLPICDPRFVSEKDPSKTYRNPGTILRNLQHLLEWVDEEGWFRRPEALKMARERAVYIRMCLTAFTTQLEESGVLSPEFPKELLPEENR